MANLIFHNATGNMLQPPVGPSYTQPAVWWLQFTLTTDSLQKYPHNWPCVSPNTCCLPFRSFHRHMALWPGPHNQRVHLLQSCSCSSVACAFSLGCTHNASCLPEGWFVWMKYGMKQGAWCHSWVSFAWLPRSALYDHIMGGLLVLKHSCRLVNFGGRLFF